MNARYVFFLSILVLRIFFGVTFAPVPRAEAASASPLPATIESKLALWLTADFGVTTNENGFVTRWTDQSGNGNHAFQTNPVSRPKLAPGAVNGQPGLRFNGTNNFLEIPHSTSLAATGDLSIFAVLQVKTLSTMNGIIGKTLRGRPAPFDFYIYEQSGQPRLTRGDGEHWSELPGSANVSTGQVLVASAVVHGTNGTMYLNGAFNGSAKVFGENKDAGKATRIGTRDDFRPWLNGDLAEIIFLRAAVSEAERTAIHNYLGRKYGLEMVLDIGVTQHPSVQRLEGQTATFSASALSSSSATLQYQWQKNGADIPEATEATYTTPALTLADNNNSYRVRISSPQTNRYGHLVSLAVVPDTEPLTVMTAAFLLRDQSHPSTSTNEGGILAPCSSRLWQTGEGFFRNAIQAIAQTSDGFLWIGTQGGLARFDGEQFEFEPLDSSADAANERINALCTGDDGSLWAATRRGLFQRTEAGWMAHPLPPGGDEIILSLCRTREGGVWMGTRSGLALCQNEKISLLGNKATTGVERDMAVQAIRSVVDGGNGDVWLTTDDKVIQFKDGRIITNYNFSAFKPGFIRAVCSTRDGSLWIGGNSGVVRVRNGEYAHYSKTNGLPNNTVTSVYEDRRGNLWIGTYGGLCRFSHEQFVTEMTPEGEVYDQVFCLFEDRENNLWVGAKNGLYQLSVQQFITYTTRHGLAHNNVVSVYEDHEGAIWIGTWGGGLHRLRGGKITIYSAAKSKVTRNDLIMAIHGASDGGIWFGEDYDGLYRLQEGEFQSYGRTQGLGRGAIRTLLEDQSGRLLIGSASSYLNVLEQGKITSYGPEHGLPTNSNRCLLQTRDGRIWVGTEAGLCHWTNGGFVTLTTNDGLSDDTIFALHEDQQQSVWIGTGKGLCRMKVSEAGDRTFHISCFTLFDDPILEILEDDFANLWLATWRGVFRVGKNELNDLEAGRISKLSPTLFGKADGMASQVCVGVAKPSAFKSRDGRLWFATTKGLAVTDPALKIEKNEDSPPVVIRAVLADKKRIQEAGVRSQGTKAEKEHSPFSPLLIPPGRGELEFHYTALSYTAPEKNRFKYKLDGLDSDWVDAGTRHTAFYNRVPPGDYTFRVIACNNDGVWNSLGASVKLSLQPHYWQTWWFNTLVILASLSFVGTGVRYATRKRMQFKLERLEHQHAIEKERTRIARDMHDDLGARLSEILLMSSCAIRNKSIPGDIKTQVEQISQSAREVIDNLDGIVWAVDPKNDFLNILAPYLYEYVEAYLKLTNMRCRFHVPEQLPHCSLSSEVRHHLFMVVKESLHNAAKYSEATEVSFCLKVESSTLFVSMEDNGKGFCVAEAASLGNGLQNMEKRIKNIGGTFILSSDLGKGTSVRIQIPLQLS